MDNKDYMYEVEFYLAFMIEKKYLGGKSLLLDNYLNAIRHIYNDYIGCYDNKKVSLMASIEEYLEKQDVFVKEILLNWKVSDK